MKTALLFYAILFINRIQSWLTTQLTETTAFGHRWELIAQTAADNGVLIEILKMDKGDWIAQKKEKARCERALNKFSKEYNYGTSEQ